MVIDVQGGVESWSALVSASCRVGLRTKFSATNILKLIEDLVKFGLQFTNRVLDLQRGYGSVSCGGGSHRSTIG